MSRRRPVRAPHRSGVRPRHRGAAAYRRLVARHPWIHWLVVVGLAVATAAHVLARDDRVEQARATWGDTRPVLVAERAIAPGEPLVASVRDVPVAIAPDAVVVPPSGSDAITYTARQHLVPGDIVTTVDVVGDGPLPLLPPGWLAVPIVESPPSGAAAGDRVQLASDGLVVAEDALVVGHLDDVTLIGVPAGEAASLPPAAESGGLVVLRQP